MAVKPKVIGHAFFGNYKGAICLVVIDNGVEKKAMISTVSNISYAKDVKFTQEFGAIFPLEEGIAACKKVGTYEE